MLIPKGAIPPYIYRDIGGVDRWVWFVSTVSRLISLVSNSRVGTWWPTRARRSVSVRGKVRNSQQTWIGGNMPRSCELVHFLVLENFNQTQPFLEVSFRFKLTELLKSLGSTWTPLRCSHWIGIACHRYYRWHHSKNNGYVHR